MRKIKWLTEWLTGLVRSAYTGQVTVTMEFNRGGIRNLRVSREEVAPEMSCRCDR